MASDLPSFRGLTVYRHLRHRYSLLYPQEWGRVDVPEESGGGVTCFPDPADPATFRACKLDFGERERHAGTYALHADLLRLRRETPAFTAQDAGRMHGAVLGPHALCLRFLNDDGDRLLVVNLGAQVDLSPAPEPLLAPPEGTRWYVEWSSEDPDYGGAGTPPVESADGSWTLPGECAVVLAPEPRPDVEEAPGG